MRNIYRFLLPFFTFFPLFPLRLPPLLRAAVASAVRAALVSSARSRMTRFGGAGRSTEVTEGATETCVRVGLLLALRSARRATPETVKRLLLLLNTN